MFPINNEALNFDFFFFVHRHLEFAQGHNTPALYNKFKNVPVTNKAILVP